MIKLLLTHSENLNDHIQHAINICNQKNQPVEEVVIFCESQAGELDRDVHDDHRLVLINRQLKMNLQSERVKECLLSNVNQDDQVMVFLQKQAKPLQLLLTQLCCSLFQNRISFLAEREKRIIPYIESGHQAAWSRLEQHIRELIYSGNYRSALKLTTDTVKSKEINQLLRFGDQLFRLDFTFNRIGGEIHPIDLLIECLMKHDLATGEEITYLQELKHYHSGSQKAFIMILHNYAEFLYGQKDMIDFIVLYYRIVEESLLYALGWDADDENRFMKRAKAQYALDFPDWPLTRHYHRYEKALRLYIRDVENHKKMKIRAGKRLNSELLTPKELYFANLYLYLRKKGIRECLDFRHEGVSGHGFADLTKEEIEIICGGQTPLQVLKPLLIEQGLLPGCSIFQLLNKGVLALLAAENEPLAYK